MLLDPAEFAMGAIRDGHVRIGDVVVVFGMGAIGLVAIQMLRDMGLERLIAIDPLPARRELAERLGADATIDPMTCDVGLEIKMMSGKRGADVVIDLSGSQHALQAAFRGVAYGGTIAEAAFPAPYAAGFDLGGEAHMNSANLVFSRACSEPNRDYPRWSEARIASNCHRLIAEGKLRGDDIITPVVGFKDLVEEYPKIASEPNRCVKLGVAF
jgi:threonine dehydrogenase-like Zn-dependent dehydrogenase